MRIPPGFITATFTDHEFARYLRKCGAVNNFKHEDNACAWRGATGAVVAIAFYDNASCAREIFIPAKGLNS